MAADDTVLQLPLSVVSRIDVGRLQREVTALDNFVEQSALRKPGSAIPLPRTSKTLDEVAQTNKLKLLEENDRKRLWQFLEEVKTQAPTLHVSFAADPSAAFIGKLITWLRSEIHPMLLLQIGLQPSIAAGCIVRTPNHYFDFSLRKHFAGQRDLLVQKIGAET
jgi:F0F1-type ATP synthase delta subunit